MAADARTVDEKIRDLESCANAVAVIEDLLKRAKRGEIRHFVAAVETTTSRDEHATVCSNITGPGERLRIIGLLHMALDRATKSW